MGRCQLEKEEAERRWDELGGRLTRQLPVDRSSEAEVSLELGKVIRRERRVQGSLSSVREGRLRLLGLGGSEDGRRRRRVTSELGKLRAC